MPKTIVILPTYNEKENIEALIKSILALKVQALEILVIDDSSPDKTGEIVKNLNNAKVHLLERKGRRGRGLAGIAGFRKALDMHADCIIEMDADLSHDPRYIPQMLEEIKRYDIILGSRLVENSKDNERTKIRKLITRLSNLYIRIVLGIKVKDCNSGFRCFRRKVIESIIGSLDSKGPDIVQEVLYKAYLKRFSIKEIPIEFRERKKGRSKLGIRQIFGGFLIVAKLKSLNIMAKKSSS